jgi:chromosomal replication initiation ATPase DnaA
MTQPTARAVLNEVCTFFDIVPREILGTSKLRGGAHSVDVVTPRQIAHYVARRATGLSYKQLALAFNRDDHTGIMHSVQSIKWRRERKEPRVLAALDHLEAKFPPIERTRSLAASQQISSLGTCQDHRG